MDYCINIILLFLHFISINSNISNRIIIPFTIISNTNNNANTLLKYNIPMPEMFRRIITTNICFNDNTSTNINTDTKCSNFSISFTTYVSWKCYPSELNQFGIITPNSLTITTSRFRLRGELQREHFYFNTHHPSSSLSSSHYSSLFLKTANYTDGCYTLLSSFNLHGELGLAMRDSANSSIKNLSLLEQQNYNNKQYKKITLLYNDTSHNDGSIILGDNSFLFTTINTNNNAPQVNLLFNDNDLKIFSNKIRKLSISNIKTYHIYNSIYAVYSNRITLLPESFYIFLKSLFTLNGNTITESTFNEMCHRTHFDSANGFGLICDKSIELDDIIFELDNNVQITIPKHKTFITHPILTSNQRLFAIGFSYITNNFIFGQNIFENYITVFDLPHKEMQLYMKVDSYETLYKLINNNSNNNGNSIMCYNIKKNILIGVSFLIGFSLIYLIIKLKCGNVNIK